MGRNLLNTLQDSACHTDSEPPEKLELAEEAVSCEPVSRTRLPDKQTITGNRSSLCLVTRFGARIVT